MNEPLRVRGDGGPAWSGDERRVKTDVAEIVGFVTFALGEVWRDILIRELREAGERERAKDAENARLRHANTVLRQLVEGAVKLLAQAEPSYERLAAGDGAGAVAEEVAP